MHFVTGGAFNGKAKWVKAYNGLTPENCRWMSAYNHDCIPFQLESVFTETIVLEGIERWIKEWLKEHSGKEVQEKWGHLLEKLGKWEKADEKRTVTFIGTDITKGIVPLAAEEREWRDVCGRIFQATASSCERVEYIWYGLNKRLK